MKSNTYSAIRLLAGVLSVLALVVQLQMPKKRLSLLSNSNFNYSVYIQHQNPDQNSYGWVDEKTHTWFCINEVGNTNTCGFSIIFSPDYKNGIDISSYKNVELSLKYNGDAQQIRIYLRNYNIRGFEDRPDEYNLAKFLYTLIRVEDLHSQMVIPLSEFRVADWWLTQINAPREASGPEFGNVSTMGFDFVSPGTNQVSIERVELTGDYLQNEDFYFALLGFWMVVIIAEGLFKIYTLSHRSKRDSVVINELVHSYTVLEEKKRLYENLSITDPLTGIMNRAGLIQFVDHLYDSDHSPSLGLILIDIDHFKGINDTRGHDAGDRILQHFAKIISDHTRESDVCGRWGGEEFLIVCAEISRSKLILLAEKLRYLVEQEKFEPDNPLRITISLGVGVVEPDEPFDTAFKRLDQALYKAKSTGRNKYIFTES